MVPSKEKGKDIVFICNMRPCTVPRVLLGSVGHPASNLFLPSVFFQTATRITSSQIKINPVTFLVMTWMDFPMLTGSHP